MKKLLLTLSFFGGFYFVSSAQYVNIPDANFKAYLLGNVYINTTPDGEITMSEAAAYNAAINCAGLGITDLTGIEAFTGYITLNCSSNSLTTLDLSSNINLGGILEVGGNPLTSLILSPSTLKLKCEQTPLTTLDLSVAPGLTHMWAMMTPFTSLDFSSNSAFIGLNIDGNQMSTIDLSPLVNLEWINVTQSALTELDISPCVSLVSLNCDYSDYLTELNMANGNNMSFAPGSFSASGCPNLSCITVDNVSFSNAVWAGEIDPGTQFSLDCSTVSPVATSLSIQGQGGATTITTPNGTLQMVATIQPVSAQGQTIIWGISAGATLASIDANGLISAIDNGVITIGALTSDGSNLSSYTNITISNQVLSISTLLDSKFTVYPNPAINSIMIQTDEHVQSVSIYSLNGELIQTETSPSFSIEALNSGLYMLTLTTDRSVGTIRFKKE